MSAPTILHGDCLAVLRTLPDASVDAIVTDPPYGLSDASGAQIADVVTAWATGDREAAPTGRGFMGKAWDAFVPPPAVWDEALRVLKPGGHLLAFAGTRTVDLMGLSIRFAGFEIRDSIAWLYGSGFPKSMDVAKAIDAHEKHGGSSTRQKRRALMGDDYVESAALGTFRQVASTMDNIATRAPERTGAPLTPSAEEWVGWGTALKPAFEPIVVARKPLVGTVAANVLAHGTGALNIAASRIGTEGGGSSCPGGEACKCGANAVFAATKHPVRDDTPRGRFPANVILDESQAAELDRQAPSASAAAPASGPTKTGRSERGSMAGHFGGTDAPPALHGDQGGASRFFYVAKAPKRERPVVDGVAHPTVKPLALMRYLVKLVTPPGGVVLDPFAGSGATVEAAIEEGFDVIAIEREAEYLPLIEARVARAAS